MELTPHIDRLPPEHEQLIKRSGWSQSGPGLFTADDLIDAYELGKKKERAEKEEKEPAGQNFLNHLYRAMDEAERFFLDLRAEHPVSPVQSYLRVSSVWPFCAEAL